MVVHCLALTAAQGSAIVHNMLTTRTHDPTTARGVRIPSRVASDIADEARRRGRSWSAVTSEILEEGIRMRRCPGIVFVDGAVGRRAALGGTGLDVWEVIQAWQDCGGDFRKLAKGFAQATEPQLRAALGYYQMYPAEIDERLAREAAITPDHIAAEYPFLAMRPRSRR